MPNIAFIGNAEFGSIILKKLAEEYKLSLAITSPDKKAGRKNNLTPTPVKRTAKKLSIPVFETEKNSEILLKLKEIKPDLLISADCSQIMTKEILELPKYKSLNIHPSLLPKYRGCSPIQSAILNGDKETGVTIFLMTEKIDQGKIIAQRKYTMKKENCLLLKKRLAEMGADLLIETIPKWIKGELNSKEQKGKSSYAKTIKKEEGRINWNNKAEEIERKIRAFCPWPSTFTFWEKGDKGIRLKILEAEVIEKEVLKPGETFLLNNSLAVKCGKNALIVKRIQKEGKKPMDSKEFLKGNSGIIGKVLK